MNGMKSKNLSMTAAPHQGETGRQLQDILGACLVRGTNIAALLDALSRVEAFQGAPADCLEALAELMAHLNEDISEAQELCELSVQSRGGTQ